MIAVFIKLVRHYLVLWLRNLYWLFNLSKIKGIGSTHIYFPVTVEGKGHISVGVGSNFGRYASLRVGAGTSLKTGKNFSLSKDAVVTIGRGGSIEAGSGLLIENFSRLYVNNHWQLGNEVKIATHCAIFSREKDCNGRLTIGDGTHIGDHTIIDMSHDVTIGSDVAIGPNSVIYTHDHDYHAKDVARWKGGVIAEPVEIGDGAWIGSGVTILPGVNIGAYSVIAAGSVVTKSIPDNTLCGGVPAKLLKEI